MKYFICVAMVSGCLSMMAAPLDIALNKHGDLMPLFAWGMIIAFASLCAGVVYGLLKGGF